MERVEREEPNEASETSLSQDLLRLLHRLLLLPMLSLSDCLSDLAQGESLSPRLSKPPSGRLGLSVELQRTLVASFFAVSESTSDCQRSPQVVAMVTDSANLLEHPEVPAVTEAGFAAETGLISPTARLPSGVGFSPATSTLTPRVSNGGALLVPQLVARRML